MSITALANAPGNRWATPGAVQVLPAGVDRDVWLAERAKGLGGSDAAAVAGFNLWTSRREVYWDKTGQLPPKAVTENMKWGIRLESAIAEGFVEETGIPVRRCGLLRSKTHPFMQVSVDRLTGDGGGLEIKNMGYFRDEEWGTDWEPLIPDAAEIQALHCMAVTGLAHWWVAGLIGGNKLIVRRVERDEATIANLIKLESDFWHGYVQAGIAPPVDGSKACEDVMRRFYSAAREEIRVVDREVLDPLLLEKDEADKAEKGAEERKRLACNKLRDLLGSATGLAYPGNDGKIPDPAVTLKANGAFSGKKFKEDHPALAAEYERPVTEVKLDTEALKSEQEDTYAACRARVLRVTKYGTAAVHAQRKAEAERIARITGEKVAV